MNIAFFGTKEYDKKHFKENYEEHTIKFLRPRLSIETAILATDFDAVCAFVNDDLSGPVIRTLAKLGVKYILMRCAGYNNVDLKTAEEYGLIVARVPAYSPEAVAEHAMTLVMAANRRIHKAYNKVRDNDYSLVGLTGMNLHGKTAGIIGTGKIGQAMIRICQGFGMNVIAYDPYPNHDMAINMKFSYMSSVYELYRKADVISLHCPMTDKNYHMINEDTISIMKDGVILVNTSRGGLINTEDLIEGIKAGKFHAVGLDVYEEENGLVFDDMSGTILEHTTTARLLSFPNVILTSHQGFLTSEALEAIAYTTMQNATLMDQSLVCYNIVKSEKVTVDKTNSNNNDTPNTEGESTKMDITVKRLARNLKHAGKVVSMYEDLVELPNGETDRWDYIERHKGGAAAVIPVCNDGKIMMIRQYRNAVDRITLEIPAGVLDSEDELYEKCAARELEEEIGYKCDSLEFLVSTISAIGFCNERVDIFVARDLNPSRQHLDSNEFVEIVSYSLDELCEMIFNGEIQDGKTIAAIMAYKAKYQM